MCEHLSIFHFIKKRVKLLSWIVLNHLYVKLQQTLGKLKYVLCFHKILDKLVEQLTLCFEFLRNNVQVRC